MRIQKIESPCGCSMQEDGINTDLLHLLPSYIYTILKKRAKIKSTKHYRNKHKDWIKKQALKKGMTLRDYLYSLSPEIGSHIEVIETFQQGGEVPEDLLDISNSINDRIEEIYKSQQPNQIQYAQKGLNKVNVNAVPKVDLTVDKGSKVNLLNDSVAPSKFGDGYKTVSNTGFIEINPQFSNQELEADSCYKLGKNNIPIKVSCQDPEAKKGDSFVKAKEGNRYYMREEIATKTKYDYTPGLPGTEGARGTEGTSTPGTEKVVIGEDWDKSKKGVNKHTKENCNSGCKGLEELTVSQLRSRISPKYFSGTRKFLNGVLNLVLAKKGTTENTIILIRHNGRDFEHAAEKGCFCQYTGEIGGEDTPGTPGTPPTPGTDPSDTSRTEQDRNVTVAEDGPNTPVKDDLRVDFVVGIPIIGKVKSGQKGEDVIPVYAQITANGTLEEGYTGYTIKAVQESPFTGTNGIGLSIRTPSGAPRPMTDEEENAIFNSSSAKERDSARFKYAKEIIDQVINSTEMKKNLEADIIPKFNQVNSNRSKIFEQKLKDGAYVNKMQGGGLYNNIGKERPFHQFNSGKERDLQELLQWKSLQVDPRYLNRK